MKIPVIEKIKRLPKQTEETLKDGFSVPKERILCSFEGRGEHEVIVNLYGFKEKPLAEKA